MNDAHSSNIFDDRLDASRAADAKDQPTDEQRAKIAEDRKALWANGYRPVALLSHTDPDPKKAGKAPYKPKWQIEALKNPPEDAHHDMALSFAMNTGILCNGLRAVDNDVGDPARNIAIEQARIKYLGETPLVRRRSNSLRCCSVYRAAEGESGFRETKGATTSGGEKDHVEVRGKNQQIAALGTHVSGVDLTWDTSPLDCPLSDVPAVTEPQVFAFLAAVATIIGGKAPRHEPRAPRTPFDDTTPAELADLEAALRLIPSDDYRTWITIGMALHHETRAAAEALHLWDGWSQSSSDKYPGQKAIEDKWAGFDNGRSHGNVGAGSIFHIAKQHGWTKTDQRDADPGYQASQDAEAAKHAPRQDQPAEASADAEDDFVLPVEFSENALAYRFSNQHADTLLYVHDTGKWLRYDRGLWREDHAVTVFDAARRICAEQGDVALNVLPKKAGTKVAAIINRASCIAAIERLARHHHRHAREGSEFNADPLSLNAPTTTGKLERKPKP
jgi:hypothetical protein